jgi:RNA recognition motif-containing protein
MYVSSINLRRCQLNIYVGNLSYETTEDELREEFTAFGEVTSVNIIKDKYSGQSKGFAFVEMPLLSAGQAAISGLNGKMLNNRQLSVSGARPRSDSRGRGPYGGGRGGRQDRGGRRRY